MEELVGDTAVEVEELVDDIVVEVVAAGRIVAGDSLVVASIVDCGLEFHYLELCNLPYSSFCIPNQEEVLLHFYHPF